MKYTLSQCTLLVKTNYRRNINLNTELTVFQHEQFGSIRSVLINDEPWFIGKDVADALGYSNSRKAIIDHVHPEDKGVTKCDTPSGAQDMTVINESGIYSLVMSSKLPSARDFKRWVTSEVLPMIRKTGGVYLSPDAAERIIEDPDLIISLATMVKKQKAQLAEAMPKVEYFDRLIDRGNALSMRDTAKALGIRETALKELLFDHGYIYRDRKNRIRPYAEKNKGYFVLREFENDKNGYTSVQTLITVEGREKLLSIIRERGLAQ